MTRSCKFTDREDINTQNFNPEEQILTSYNLKRATASIYLSTWYDANDQIDYQSTKKTINQWMNKLINQKTN